MAVPKELHQFLLKKSFRHVGSGAYWCLFENKPVAKVVCVDDYDGVDGRTFQISLHLGWPYGNYLNFSEKLCTDGLLRPQTADARLNELYDYSFDSPEYALKIVDDLMYYWFNIIGDPNVMIALIDFCIGVRPAPPDVFDSIVEHYARNNIPRVEGAAMLHEKICYLIIAEKFQEAEDLLLNNDVVLRSLKKRNPDDYSLFLDTVREKKIIPPSDFYDWVESKKIPANGNL